MAKEKKLRLRKAAVLIILFSGIIKKMPVYELFVDGAKDGVKIGFNILYDS